MPASQLQDLLNESASMHDHLCPRQVLGVRMGMYAAELFGLELPQQDKRLLAIVENDGCFADGVAVSTGCWLGHRTMRLADFGKVAVTVVDTLTGDAFRIHPSEKSRQMVKRYAPDAASRWHAYLEGYQLIPLRELLVADRVRLIQPVTELVSVPGHRVVCEECGEEILNEREIVIDGRVLCRGCGGHAYLTICDMPEGFPIDER